MRLVGWGGLLLCSATASAQGVLRIVSGPEQIGVGAPTAPFYVELQQPDGGPLIAASDLTFQLVSTSDGGQFGDQPQNPAWANPYGPLTIAAGQSMSTGSFVYRDAIVGTAAIAANAGGTAASEQEQVQVEPMTIQEDFESGALEAWPYQVSDSRHTLQVTPTAAHRGQFGLEVQDLDGSPSGTSERANVLLELPPLGAAYHARAWLRVTPTSDAGNIVPADVSGLIGLELDVAQGPMVDGEAPPGAFLVDPSLVSWRDGQWHLVEFSVVGLGTLDGGRRVWIDGALADARDDLNYGTSSVSGLTFGEPVENDGRFTGTIDLDDIRAGIEPLAERITLVAVDGGPFQAGACVALQIGLVSPEGSAAPAPYDVPVVLSAATGQFYADARCTAPASVVAVQAGQSAMAAGFASAQQGSAMLTAAHIDFLAASATVTLQGTCQGPTCVRVGSALGPSWRRVGCSTTDGSNALGAATVLMSLWWWTRRGRGKERGLGQ